MGRVALECIVGYTIIRIKLQLLAEVYIHTHTAIDYNHATRSTPLQLFIG